ncbi:MAG: hypothetical protein ABIF85_02090 [Nanoarchaeota archaeon]|nr:hypothetical protein [Nanoarchaeota archaeon]MBU4300866.1 hypothetical protein [Nanoarchaeota archaeon]MBU4451428.1 hypothetical protein [Nanoarchaeota archaeon]MCG2724498.1 hypothetical protein [archaeon]
MPVIRLPKEYSFEKFGIKGRTFDTKSINNAIKFNIIETEKGHETRIREKECTFHYFIIEGAGNFEIDGNVKSCQKGDLVIVRKGAAFKYTGKMKMLLVSQPWWNPEQEEILAD